MIAVPDLKGERGTYALVLALDKETTLVVGKLGLFSFPSGYYVYVGSALRGLWGRVKRHIIGGKSLRWHIDYLRHRCEIAEVWYVLSPARLECTWYRAASRMPAACLPVRGFGSSDCHCPSHLIHYPSLPSFRLFRDGLGRQGMGLKRLRLQKIKIGGSVGGKQ